MGNTYFIQVVLEEKILKPVLENGKGCFERIPSEDLACLGGIIRSPWTASTKDNEFEVVNEIIQALETEHPEFRTEEVKINRTDFIQA